ncbi:hypothetical protein [Kordia sp.]|uniref:hypothetical protein n=1 Tax=Kordia sp. TaxID=1965332 RepID=UPI003B5CD158
MKHKGYNNQIVGSKNNYKTYQGQELTEDLNLNWYEWKYRFSDPSTGRFISIDPLAEDYVYNSIYAFQENKLGMGIELEGAELIRRAKEGLSQFFTGLFNLSTNETTGEVKRQMEIANTENEQKKELIEIDGRNKTNNAISNVSEGLIETSKGAGQILGTSMEVTGDVISALGMVSAQPEIIALGESVSNAGTGINIVIDFTDGKDPVKVIGEQVPAAIFGKLGKEGTAATRRIAGEKFVKEGKNHATEAGIKATEKILEETTNIFIEEAKPKPVKHEKK